MFKVAFLLFIISISIMMLSIVAVDNFGNDHVEIFSLKEETQQDKANHEKEYRNQEKDQSTLDEAVINTFPIIKETFD